MDQFEQLSGDAECAVVVAVLGNAVTGHHVLIDLDHDAPMSDAATLEARQRGFEFVGLLGIKGGLADAVCEPGPAALSLMCHATVPFVTRYAAKLGPKSDAGADWLERLHALPDLREN